MKRLLTLLLLVSSAAVAQTSDELTKAALTCFGHATKHPLMMGKNLPPISETTIFEFQEGWNNCHSIMKAYAKAKANEEAAARVQKEQQDKAAVDAVAEKLK